MGRSRLAVGFAMAVAGWLFGPYALGAGRVELVVAADRQAPLVAQQTWIRELGEAGVQHVRIRQQRSSDRPEIEVRGSKTSPTYVVTGVLDSLGQLVLPGGRYRSGEARRVAAWLADVARHGPPESREPVVAFGLPRSQMEAVRADLAAPVGFSTRQQPRSTLVRQIIDRLKLPVRMDENLLPAREDDRVAEELGQLSRGTGLAFVLRPAGLVLVPKTSPQGPEYLITTARGQRETWPIGWKPEKRVTDVLPKMFEQVTIDLENVSVGSVLGAIEKRVEVPVLLDHAALARHGVDTGKLINVPRRRTSYDSALDQALFQAKMKHELRTDEADRPFLWVTTLRQ